ncbi:MAG: ribonuclease P protein component [Parcubacteria group bacterium]
MALSKLHRLTRKRDIDAVYQNGKTVKGSFFFVRFLKNDLNNARIAVIVSTKARKTNVERNSIRRKVQAVLGVDELLQSHFDILIIVVESILRKPADEIKTEIHKVIEKIMVKF